MAENYKSSRENGKSTIAMNELIESFNKVEILLYQINIALDTAYQDMHNLTNKIKKFVGEVKINGKDA